MSEPRRRCACYCCSEGCPVLLRYDSGWMRCQFCRRYHLDVFHETVIGWWRLEDMHDA